MKFIVIHVSPKVGSRTSGTFDTLEEALGWALKSNLPLPWTVDYIHIVPPQKSLPKLQAA